MDMLWIGTATIGSLGTAFLVQRALLSALLLALDPNRKPRS
jgi:hypothetical protein